MQTNGGQLSVASG